jgi:Domain of unknown function (DUF4386)
MPAVVERSVAWSPRGLGRTIAVLSLVTMVFGIFAQAGVSERLITFRDPARTAANILSNESLYTAGFTLYMIEMASQIATTVLLYHLLKPVNRRVASLALVFGLVGCTIKVFSRVLYLAPLFVLKQPSLSALAADQRDALSLVLLRINDRGAGVALCFFGFETVFEGWLMFRSTFLPRWLGVLSMIAGAGWLTWLSPSLGDATFNIVALFGLAGLVALIGWLLFKGVDETRWYAINAESAA